MHLNSINQLEVLNNKYSTTAETKDIDIVHMTTDYDYQQHDKCDDVCSFPANSEIGVINSCLDKVNYQHENEVHKTNYFPFMAENSLLSNYSWIVYSNGDGQWCNSFTFTFLKQCSHTTITS